MGRVVAKADSLMSPARLIRLVYGTLTAAGVGLMIGAIWGREWAERVFEWAWTILLAWVWGWR